MCGDEFECRQEEACDFSVDDMEWANTQELDFKENDEAWAARCAEKGSHRPVEDFMLLPLSDAEYTAIKGPHMTTCSYILTVINAAIGALNRGAASAGLFLQFDPHDLKILVNSCVKSAANCKPLLRTQFLGLPHDLWSHLMSENLDLVSMASMAVCSQDSYQASMGGIRRFVVNEVIAGLLASRRMSHNIRGYLACIYQGDCSGIASKQFERSPVPDQLREIKWVNWDDPDKWKQMRALSPMAKLQVESNDVRMEKSTVGHVLGDAGFHRCPTALEKAPEERAGATASTTPTDSAMSPCTHMRKKNKGNDAACANKAEIHALSQNAAECVEDVVTVGTPTPAALTQSTPPAGSGEQMPPMMSEAEWQDYFKQYLPLDHWVSLRDFTILREGSTLLTPQMIAPYLGRPIGDSTQVLLGTSQYDDAYSGRCRSACVIISVSLCQFALGRLDQHGSIPLQQELIALHYDLAEGFHRLIEGAGQIKENVCKALKKPIGSHLGVAEVLQCTKALGIDCKLGWESFGTSYEQMSMLRPHLSATGRQAWVVISSAYSATVILVGGDEFFISDSHGKSWKGIQNLTKGRDGKEKWIATPSTKSRRSAFVIHVKGFEAFANMVHQLFGDDKNASWHEIRQTEVQGAASVMAYVGRYSASSRPRRLRSHTGKYTDHVEQRKGSHKIIDTDQRSIGEFLIKKPQKVPIFKSIAKD